MRVKRVVVEPAGDGFRASAFIESDRGPNGELWYEVSGGTALPSLEMAASAFAAACLPTAVHWEEDLTVDDPVDQAFLYRLPRLARGHARLHGRARTTQINASGTASAPRPDRVVGMSFSGGVDSFYTLRDNLDPQGPTPVRALVTGLGLDTHPDDEKTHGELMKRLRAVSDEHNLRHFAVRTNFRPFFDPYADPSVVTQGACLVAFAFLLSGELHTYLIPASAPLDRLYPWSSHAVLDSAWIAGPTATLCDGWDIHRNDKLKAIADWPLAMRTLRVCGSGRGADNCGRCEKCVRTMALLLLEGIEDPPCFPQALTASDVLRLRVYSTKKHYWWIKIREAAGQKPETAWLAKATGRMLLRNRIVGRIKTLRRQAKTRERWPLRRYD